MRITITLSLILQTVFLCGQSPHVSPQNSIAKTLELSFPDWSTFIHHEPDEKVLADTLSYQFYSPKVQIEKDTLYLSYVQKIKGYDVELTIEKIEQSIPLACIEELNTFNFTFGATDRFEPPLAYLGFWMDKKGCNQAKVYGIDPELWESKRFSDSDFKLLHTTAPYVAKFPALMARNVLSNLRRNLKLAQNL